jgi:Methylase involved in ubiquinone/menaquinone biosynthesis
MKGLLITAPGSGICSKCMAEKLTKGQLTCIDISSRWLDVARKRLNHYPNTKLLQGYIADLNLKPDFFDLVIIHFVIHDIPKQERKQILDALKMALRPRGRLVIREPLSQKHSMQAEALHNLLTGCGFKRISLTTSKIRFIGNVVDAVYENPLN